MKVLLHTCCAPCATHCIEVLRGLEHEPCLFFSNANIYPAEEFNKRLHEVIRLAKITDVPIIIDEPDHQGWLKNVAAGLEDEPEKGRRCNACFHYALQRTYTRMLLEGMDAITTTLSVSPHKSSETLSQIGRELAQERYLEINFKKEDGFKRSIELSNRYNLYRQSYCGCEFSRRI
ncbi:MAG: epoxyqueuosine reductase QueH [Bacteroidales bacterium]|nr:epoxyqueuosine reductase QueH [Bacteroidales bacterium]